MGKNENESDRERAVCGSYTRTGRKSEREKVHLHKVLLTVED